MSNKYVVFWVGMFMVGFENVWTFTGVRTSDAVSELHEKMGMACCFPIFSASGELRPDELFYLALCDKNAAPIEARAAN